jgi:hypothetical protein
LTKIKKYAIISSYMVEKKVAPTEDPALIEWKQDQVEENMERFRRKVVGKQGDLYVGTLEMSYSWPRTTKANIMRMAVRMNDPNDQMFKYPFEITNLIRRITSTSKKYGAEPQGEWQFSRPSSDLSFNHYMRTFSFLTTITRTDRFMYGLQKGKGFGRISQALHGFAKKQ